MKMMKPMAKAPMQREAMIMSNSKLVTYTNMVKNMSKGRGGKKIDKIFVHHMAGNLTVKQCGNVFATRQASAHYGVQGKNIGQYVDESNTAWHCGNFAYNQRSIGIELANDGGASNNWHVSDQTIATAIDLIVDICKRNGIKKLNFTGDLSGNLCMHCYCASTACPGGYLKTKFKYIAEQVNKKLNASGSTSSTSPTSSSAKNKWQTYKLPFKVKVSIKDLRIRSGAGTSYKVVTVDKSQYIKPGVYTIIEVKVAGGYTWGKLKSSTKKEPRWIALDYTTKV